MEKIILFQGDSITDANRSMENDNNPGCGYATMIEGYLGVKYPGKFRFYNRGVGGHKLADVYSRMNGHIIHLKPDYMSILVGVNDVWHEIDWNNGTKPECFERLYNIMIEDIKSELPNIKIMLMEPFVLEGAATENTEKDPNRFYKFKTGVRMMADATKRVAKKNNLYYLPLQKMFDDAINIMPMEYWLIDGVHPTVKGYELIKNKWLNAFSEITGEEI